MERLFERYVTSCLRGLLLPDASLIATASSKYLCRHRESEWFQLQPDILVQRENLSWVLDAKWKRLNAALGNAKDKYKIQQEDLYQMFAYGHKYLGGQGDLFLIYPRTNDFACALDPFHLSESLMLRVIAFDLDQGVFIGDLTGLPLHTDCSKDLQAVA